MDLKNFIDQLEASSPEASLHILLPSGAFVPAHFHITEVGSVQKAFIDCGGTRRDALSCLLQVWTADDVEHRLTANKLARILRLGEQTLGLPDELQVEIEYGEEVASHYVLSKVVCQNKALLLVLSGKKTDCLAPDKCGINKCKKGECC